MAAAEDLDIASLLAPRQGWIKIAQDRAHWTLRSR
jgi:hypothetical protein